VVDDEDGVRNAACRILTGAGYRVISAASGVAALEVAGHHDGPIHAVLTDVVMPGMNGPQLAEALRASYPHTPVLYMSGYAAPLMTEQGLLEPGVTVVGKPFNKRDLLAAVGETLQRRPGPSPVLHTPDHLVRTGHQGQPTAERG
jgi:CheY-like chemotaxis protein